MDQVTHKPLSFIRGGSASLELCAVESIPERWTVERRGKTFVGDEPLVRTLEGRVHGNVCYRAHAVVLTVMTNRALESSDCFLRFTDRSTVVFVSETTGLGTQHFKVTSYALTARIMDLLQLSDDALHGVLTCLIGAQLGGARYGYQLASREYRTAFVQGRLKKHKVRGTNQVKVEIEDAAATCGATVPR